MTIGELISALKRKDQAEEVSFDFVHLKPNGTIHSYRGDYRQIALGYDCSCKSSPKRVTVGELVALLQSAIGETFIGYKGGEYEMHEGAIVHVANYGESGSTVIVDVADQLYVTLVTERQD